MAIFALVISGSQLAFADELPRPESTWDNFGWAKVEPISRGYDFSDIEVFEVIVDMNRENTEQILCHALETLCSQEGTCELFGWMRKKMIESMKALSRHLRDYDAHCFIFVEGEDGAVNMPDEYFAHCDTDIEYECESSRIRRGME